MSRAEEIAARTEIATPGPWFVEAHGIMDAFRSYTIVHTGESDQDALDAAFIACSRSDIPFLLARVASLEAALKDVLDSQRSIFVIWARWSEDGNANDAEALTIREKAHERARRVLGESSPKPKGAE